MKILFDINHPVDVNFFKKSIHELELQGHVIFLIYRARGKLEKILKFELGEFHVTKIGEHKKSFIAKVFGQLKRDFLVAKFLWKNNIDLVVCFGSTSAISSKFCRVPYLAFDDDFEYKIPFYHANWFCTRHIYPDFIEFSNKKTYKYHGFKELAYLHPNHLSLNEEVLNAYSLKRNGYVFIREIDQISLNYSDNVSILESIIHEVISRGLKVVLSLENKELENQYSSDCIVLKEPVENFYSLLFYARYAISSGDSVAREASLLGVPTIYTGGREMLVNKPLIQEGLMHESVDINGLKELMNKLNIEKKEWTYERCKSLINNEWEDTTSVILNHVYDFQTE